MEEIKHGTLPGFYFHILKVCTVYIIINIIINHFYLTFYVCL